MKFLSLLFLTISLLGIAPLSASTWTLFDGSEFDAELVKFDYKTKTLFFTRADGIETTHNSKDLAFTSKRKLLFSQQFRKSYSEVDTTLWPAGKIWAFAIVAISPVIFLIIGMWVAGLFIAKKFNPFKAVGAFIGSYLAGIVLLACYFIFSEKANSTTFIWVGAAVAAVAMTFFIASIYDTKFIGGLLILITHFIFAGLIAGLLIYGTEFFFPVNQISAIWDQYIFSKVGLLDGPSRVGY